MAHFSRRDVTTYSALNNEIAPPLGNLIDQTNAAPTMISLEHEQEDATNVIIHKVPKNKEGWTHIEDLDSFFTRMYRYYVHGGFYPMILTDLFCLLQFIFIVWFSTFLVHCVDYQRLFRNDPNANRTEKLTLDDVILSSSVCIEKISWRWWCIIVLCSIIWLMRLFLSIYHLYYAYDTKLFYNNALRIKEEPYPETTSLIQYPANNNLDKVKMLSEVEKSSPDNLQNISGLTTLLNLNDLSENQCFSLDSFNLSGLSTDDKNISPQIRENNITKQMPNNLSGLESDPYNFASDFCDTNFELRTSSKARRSLDFTEHKVENQSDLAWVNWSTIQDRVREAQPEHHMCVHKQEINELDIYHRILRRNNYMVAMVNKNLLPLQIHVPCVGSFHYLSRGLKWNLEFLLFSSPWSPWENCWQLRESYKDHSKRMLLARQLERQILLLALFNLLFAPFIQAWQILYFFFNYAELIKRSPASLGLRTWSLYARITLRHFNELEHELRDRLNRAHKPATKYLASFTSPITTVVAKNVVFLSGSILGVLVVLSVYDEDVLTVEHVLSIITILGCILAGARALIGEEERLGGGCTGPARGEELFVQVLGHVHYLPAAWRGRAHTKDVAAHFQQLFQFRAVYILFELLSPLLCPMVLFSLRFRALDIVDFYRNFTVNVLGIGDVCSFAQLDIRRHGHPDWQTPGKYGDKMKARNTQYDQGESGKTELSLVAFSCRHPGWQPAEPSQRHFLRSLRQSMNHALPTNNHLNKTMLGSYIQQSLFGAITPMPAVLSYYPQQRQQQYRLPEMDETSDEEDGNDPSGSGLAGVSSTLGASALGVQSTPDRCDDTHDMSVSTLHLYDLHLSQAGQNVSACCTNNCSERNQEQHWGSGENTPLLHRP